MGRVARSAIVRAAGRATVTPANLPNRVGWPTAARGRKTARAFVPRRFRKPLQHNKLSPAEALDSVLPGATATGRLTNVGNTSACGFFDFQPLQKSFHALFSCLSTSLRRIRTRRFGFDVPLLVCLDTLQATYLLF